ncbi:GNAT family N-acetyltransferase [Lentilactobacillus curieae]
MVIQFRRGNTAMVSELKQLYDSVEWYAYTQNPQNLYVAVQNSLSVFQAWDKDKLVGQIRAVGDGISILYIQDILISPDYQNQGIGTALIKRMLGAYPNVRQRVLLTEEAPDVRHFYEKCGFISADQGETVAFVMLQ